MSTPSQVTKEHSFYEIQPNGKMCFFVDATLVKDFLICERRFMLKHVKNLRWRGEGGKSLPLVIGGWWSDVMENFYNALKDGVVIDKAKIQEIAVKAWAENGVEQAAASDPDKYDKFGNLPGAVLMLQEYFESQYSIDSRIWKVIATEAGFGLNKEVFVGESNSVVVYWVGKPDLVVVENGRLIPVDHKTVTKIDGRTIGKYKPGPQMPGYVFANEIIARSLGYTDVRVDRCIVNICAREKPAEKPRDGKKKPRFIRAYPNYTVAEIDEWRTQMVITCERMAQCIRRNEWQWNTNSCHNIFMRDCEFLKADSSTPAARDIVLASDFQRTAPWQPYKLEQKEEE